MATGFASADKQAELLKDKGNLYFKKDRLFAAIEAYTEVGFDFEAVDRFATLGFDGGI